MKHKKAVKMLNALGQETRINIYKLLYNVKNGLRAGEIATLLKIPDATLSFHLMMLLQASLIKSTKQGRNITYFAKKKAIISLNAYLQEPVNSGAEDSGVEADN